jgi:hypothetical protein
MPLIEVTLAEGVRTHAARLRRVLVDDQYAVRNLRRTVPTERSAIASACGARIGALLVERSSTGPAPA